MCRGGAGGRFALNRERNAELDNQRLGLKSSYDGLRSRYKKLNGNSLSGIPDGEKDVFDRLYESGKNAPMVNNGKGFSSPSYDFKKANYDAMNAAYEDLNSRYKRLSQQQIQPQNPLAQAPQPQPQPQPEPLQPPRQPGLNGALQAIGNQYMARNGMGQIPNNSQVYQGFITK